MTYTVTRQIQWPDGKAVVEIARGGIDYVNPDALVAKFPGEFQTFDSAIEATDTAIAICRSWRQAGRKDAKIGFGFTGGFTMPFDSCTFKEARKWAQSQPVITQPDDNEEGDFE